MTPADKDAMALAVLDKAVLRLMHTGVREDLLDADAINQVRPHFAHLAARVAEDADEIFRLNTRLVEETNRADRAEADLAEVLAFLRDDATAISYQSLGQYRKAALDAARGAG